MTPHNKRVTDQVIIESYQRTGNVHKTALEVGLNHTSVHERLVRLGLNKRKAVMTEAERQRLLCDYIQYRNSGRLKELSQEMGRQVTSLCRLARQLGLTNYRHQKLYRGKWKYMSADAAAKLFGKFKRSSFGVGQFCARYQLDDLSFSRTMQQFFPDEWDLVVESKAPRQTLYRLGRAFEYRARDFLRNCGYFVLRSPRSGSPVDLVAVKKGTNLFIQCKLDGNLRVKDWNALFDLSESVGSIPVLAESATGRDGLTFWRLTARKNGSRERQPKAIYLPNLLD